MATPTSVQAPDRRTQRRLDTIEEALDHAVDVMAEGGVGALTISEVARRMGVRGPSLYKYFPSLHAMYDALFARGVLLNDTAVHEALEGVEPGVPTLREAARQVVRWAVENPGLSQLLYWRPVPGFEPSERSLALSAAGMREARDHLTTAVSRGQLRPDADSDEALRMLTVVMSGLLSQQMANEPGAAYATGVFTRLTDEALDMLFTHYSP